MSLIKSIAARLPTTWQNEMKRFYFARQIRKGRFFTDEVEFALLPNLVKAGDWVIDIGANIGQYSQRLSELVGSEGRVIAFEPVPETFALLAANCQKFALSNVTLINAAASHAASIASMSIPSFEGGLKNFYQAHIIDAADSADLKIMTLSVDSLRLSNRIALIKIDAEGHEAGVIKGLLTIIDRDRPTLIVETFANEIIQDLKSRGYFAERLRGSSNVIFRHAN
jgi:FkbM family methyltransferase